MTPTSPPWPTVGLDGCEAHVTLAGTGRVPGELLRDARGWSDDEWAEAVDRSSSRGLLGPRGAAHGRRAARSAAAWRSAPTGRQRSLAERHRRRAGSRRRRAPARSGPGWRAWSRSGCPTRWAGSRSPCRDAGSTGPGCGCGMTSDWERISVMSDGTVEHGELVVPPEAPVRYRERAREREFVSEPAKVMRVGSMIKQLLEEVRSTAARRAFPSAAAGDLRHVDQGAGLGPLTGSPRRALAAGVPVRRGRNAHRRRAAGRAGAAGGLARRAVPRHPGHAVRPADGGPSAAREHARPAAAGDDPTRRPRGSRWAEPSEDRPGTYI